MRRAEWHQEAWKMRFKEGALSGCLFWPGRDGTAWVQTPWFWQTAKIPDENGAGLLYKHRAQAPPFSCCHRAPVWAPPENTRMQLDGTLQACHNACCCSTARTGNDSSPVRPQNHAEAPGLPSSAPSLPASAGPAPFQTGQPVLEVALKYGSDAGNTATGTMSPGNPAQ